MATTITKWLLIAILFVAMKHELLIEGQQQVPCLFFFGDSLIDNGNNNDLITLAKFNYPPYGVDYPGGIPTGRSTNGRDISDFLAQLLGFANPIPLFVTTRGSDILRGVNYASAVGGILDATGTQVGERFSLNKQLQNHQITIDGIAVLLGNRTAVDGLLRQCLYVVNIGSDDYVNNYYFPISLFRALYTPDRFAALLVQRLSQQLRTLYNLGSRKVAVFGQTLLGCIPQELALYPTDGSPCVDSINNAVELYNNRLISLVKDLNSNLTDAHFTIINITHILSGDLSVIGIRVNNTPCSEVGGIMGLCVANGVPCSNRNEYAFYDNYHPTEILYNLTASRAYRALLPTDAYPVDIRTLAHQ